MALRGTDVLSIAVFYGKTDMNFKFFLKLRLLKGKQYFTWIVIHFGGTIRLILIRENDMVSSKMKN